MRIGIVCSKPERFVETVKRRYPRAVINHGSNTAKFGGVELVMVNTPERVVGYEFDKAWVDESGSLELASLIETRVRPPAA